MHLYYICPYMSSVEEATLTSPGIPVSHGFMAPRCDQQNISTTCRHDSSCVKSYCFQCHHRLIWHRFLKAKRRLTVATCKRLFLYVHVSHYIYIHLACVLNSPGRENKSWRQNRSLEVLASGAHRSHHVALHQPNSYHPRDMPKLCTCQHG